MLADDDVLLDELGEEGERMLEAVERRPLTEIDPNDGSGPTDVIIQLLKHTIKFISNKLFK